MLTLSCCSREMFKDFTTQNISLFSCCSRMDRGVVAKDCVKVFNKIALSWLLLYMYILFMIKLWFSRRNLSIFISEAMKWHEAQNRWSESWKKIKKKKKLSFKLHRFSWYIGIMLRSFTSYTQSDFHGFCLKCMSVNFWIVKLMLFYYILLPCSKRILFTVYPSKTFQ